MRPSGRARRGLFISYARSDGEAAARALHERLAAELPDMPSGGALGRFGTRLPYADIARDVAHLLRLHGA